jgi:hypothetical protein
MKGKSAKTAVWPGFCKRECGGKGVGGDGMAVSQA